MFSIACILQERRFFLIAHRVSRVTTATNRYARLGKCLDSLPISRDRAELPPQRGFSESPWPILMFRRLRAVGKVATYRNPQTFVDIYAAGCKHFQKATLPPHPMTRVLSQ
jgi:hypothetical protein